MVDRLVLVNGLPGSGKTTLATALAAFLSVPLVSKDAIKEALAGAVPAVPASSLGAIAMETAWSLVAEVPGTVLLESWWFRQRDLHFVKAALDRCYAAVVVELWCDVPPHIARRRFEARRRHAVHQDARRLADSWDEWAASAEPLGVGLTLRVPTVEPVAVPTLATDLLQAMDGHAF